VDGRSDIFSLGVVLYELLTSRKPFQGENLTAISYKIVHEEFTPPAELSPEVPPDFNTIVARAMAKDPWNRYQRGKDLALALHQLKARLEEQRALRDLGTMVSAAENMPTLRLENLEKLVAEAAARQAQVPGQPRQQLDVDRADWTEDSGAGARRESPAAAPELPPPPAPMASAAPPAARTSDAAPKTPVALLDQPPDARTVAIPILANLTAPPPEIAAAPPPPPVRETPPPPAAPPVLPVIPELPPREPLRESAAVTPTPLPPTQPLGEAAKAAVASPMVARLRALTARLSRGEWTKWLRAEVNTPYFWGATGAVALFAFLVCGALLARASMVARPTAPIDPVVERETQERKRALEDAKKQFSAGNYEQSLALLRQVLARSPGNQTARQYAQMAENALAGRAEEARKSAEADRNLEAARTAFADNKYEDAIRDADAALALDGSKVEAQQLKDQALGKMAADKAAAAEASRKKKEESKRAASTKRPQPAAPNQASAAQRPAQAAAPAAVPSGPATLRLLFDSPISEGSLMVYVNDEKVLQKAFDFSRKVSIFKRVDGTGTVDAPIQVQSGPVSVKVWLSGKGLSAAAYSTASGQIAGGETKTLKLDYANGKLSALIQ